MLTTCQGDDNKVSVLKVTDTGLGLGPGVCRLLISFLNKHLEALVESEILLLILDQFHEDLWRESSAGKNELRLTSEWHVPFWRGSVWLAWASALGRRQEVYSQACHWTTSISVAKTFGDKGQPHSCVTLSVLCLATELSLETGLLDKVLDIESNQKLLSSPGYG